MNDPVEKEISKIEKLQDLNVIQNQLNRINREFSLLYEVSAAMRTTLELDQVLRIILTGVTSHLGLSYNRALLFLLNQKTQCLECKIAIGPESGEHANKIWRDIDTSKKNLDEFIKINHSSDSNYQHSITKSLKNYKFPINEESDSLLSKAFNKGSPWHLSPEEISVYAQDPLLKNFYTNELVIMPLKAKDEMLGLIIADNLFTKKPIKSEEIKIFTLLANQAALAIENSRLYEMIVHKSHTDSLTNLWNHGYFQETLDRFLSKAKKENTPLSLALIDLDNFKKFNDTYGHQNGDIILKEISDIFREYSRDIDFVCRYGGEEFAIIFINTNNQQSYDIAERLRDRIEQHQFSTFAPDPTIKITVSIGLASFPEHGQTKEELIANADKTMYIAKFSGKNKTCIADMEM